MKKKWSNVNAHRSPWHQKQFYNALRANFVFLVVFVLLGFTTLLYSYFLARLYDTSWSPLALSPYVHVWFCFSPLCIHLFWVSLSTYFWLFFFLVSGRTIKAWPFLLLFPSPPHFLHVITYTESRSSSASWNDDTRCSHLLSTRRKLQCLCRKLLK